MTYVSSLSAKLGKVIKLTDLDLIASFMAVVRILIVPKSRSIENR